MFGGWHRDPDYEKIIKQHHGIVAGKRPSPIKSEIAYVTDEHAVHNFSVGAISILRSASSEQTNEMRFVGAPYRMFLAEDLARDDFPADDYKIYIFGLFCRPSDKVREAIEKKLTASVRELSRIITQSKVRDKEQNVKYDAMVEEMKANGYCDHCCNVILKYAANNLWKD